MKRRLHLRKRDYDLALLWFLLATLVAILLPQLYLVLGAAVAALNLAHVRYVEFNAGEPFERRVGAVLRDELAEFNKRLALMERGVEDVKDAQVRIAGTFRGRQMP